MKVRAFSSPVSPSCCASRACWSSAPRSRSSRLAVMRKKPSRTTVFHTGIEAWLYGWPAPRSAPYQLSADSTHSR